MSKLRRRSGTPNEGDGAGTGNDIQVPQANNNVVVVNQSVCYRVAQSCYEFCRRHLILIIALIFFSAGGITVTFILLYHYDVLGQKKETATKNDDSAKPVNDEKTPSHDHHDGRKDTKPSSDERSHSSTDNGGEEAHSGARLRLKRVDDKGAPIDDPDDNLEIDDGNVRVVKDYKHYRVELCGTVTKNYVVTILGVKKTDIFFELEYNRDAEQAPETDKEVAWTTPESGNKKVTVQPPLDLLENQRFVVSPKDGVITRYDKPKEKPSREWKITKHGETIQKLRIATFGPGAVEVSKEPVE